MAIKQVFKGACCGVRVHQHDPDKASNYLVDLIIEDDGNWFVQNFNIDSAWLQDLITQLEAAKAYVETQKWR